MVVYVSSLSLAERIEIWSQPLIQRQNDHAQSYRVAAGWENSKAKQARVYAQRWQRDDYLDIMSIQRKIGLCNDE